MKTTCFAPANRGEAAVLGTTRTATDIIAPACVAVSGTARMGGRQIAPQPYVYLKSRTCVKWVQRGGVGPKIVIGSYAC